MIIPIVALSQSLGYASALITVADKISWLSNEHRYRNNPEHMRDMLLDQFYNVHQRTLSRLEDEIKEMEDEAEKERNLELLHDISRENAWYNYIYEYKNRPTLRSQYVDELLRTTEDIRRRYSRDERVQKLSRLYTEIFHQELSHFNELSRWYNSVTEQIIRCYLEEIKMSVERGYQLTKNIVENTAAIHDEVLKGEKISIGIKEFLDKIMLALMVSLSGTGMVFLIGVFFNVKLGNVMIICIPVCFLISDLSICSFKNTIIFNSVRHSMRSVAQVSYLFLELLVFSLLQAIVAGTCIFILQSLFPTSIESAGLSFWVLALLSGCAVTQSIREPQYVKVKRQMLLRNNEWR